MPNFISLKNMGLFVAGISVFALLGAFTAQYGFGLRPCELCLIQRVPFAVNIILGLIIALIPSPLRGEGQGGGDIRGIRKGLIFLSGLVFFVNAGIAFYHSGVERKWWTGLTGCTTPDMSGSIEDVLKRIQETNVVRCDEIPWDLFGLSMANYNVGFCLVLGAVCLVIAKYKD